MQRIIIEESSFYIIYLIILHSINYFKQNLNVVVEKISLIFFDESRKGTKLADWK